MSAGRILAVDVGDRRIGLAISDPLNLTAQPLFTLHRTTLRADLKSIGRFIRRHEVKALVVGDPLNADGTASTQTEKARAFAQALFAEHADLEHHTLDERLTTREAHELLDARGTRSGAAHRIDRKALIDQVAATLLLEAFMSQQYGPTLLPDPSPEPDH
jgi:putative holliday junction resolvase